MWSPPSGNLVDSKPKQGCTDSWRLSCKIKQKNKLLFYTPPPRLEVVSSPSASAVSYLESVCFKNKDSSEMGSMEGKQLERLKIRIPLDGRTWGHKVTRGRYYICLWETYKGLRWPITGRVMDGRVKWSAFPVTPRRHHVLNPLLFG